MRNKIAGIYSLTNKTTGKRYIGQTVYLNGRKGDHLLNLRRNQHNNDYLQKAFNKYGEEDFIFEVLEVVPKLENGANDKDKLTEREQYWMDYYKAYDRDYGYNINPSASINPMQGKTHTDEAKAKMSEAAKGRVLSEDNKQKLIESRKGKPSNSREKEAKVDFSARKIGISRKKAEFEYHIKDLQGNEYIFNNLNEFCRNHNLSQSHFRNMLNHGKFYKGWTGYKKSLKD